MGATILIYEDLDERQIPYLCRPYCLFSIYNQIISKD